MEKQWNKTHGENILLVNNQFMKTMNWLKK